MLKENNKHISKKRRRSSSEKINYVGVDGFLHQSDTEADWSDVGEDL